VSANKIAALLRGSPDQALQGFALLEALDSPRLDDRFLSRQTLLVTEDGPLLGRCWPITTLRDPAAGSLTDRWRQRSTELQILCASSQRYDLSELEPLSGLHTLEAACVAGGALDCTAPARLFPRLERLVCVRSGLPQVGMSAVPDLTFHRELWGAYDGLSGGVVQSLSLERCTALDSLEGLPPSLSALHLRDCARLSLAPLHTLSLRELTASGELWELRELLSVFGDRLRRLHFTVCSGNQDVSEILQEATALRELSLVMRQLTRVRGHGGLTQLSLHRALIGSRLFAQAGLRRLRLVKCRVCGVGPVEVAPTVVSLVATGLDVQPDRLVAGALRELTIDTGPRAPHQSLSRIELPDTSNLESIHIRCESPLRLVLGGSAPRLRRARLSPAVSIDTSQMSDVPLMLLERRGRA